MSGRRPPTPGRAERWDLWNRLAGLVLLASSASCISSTQEFSFNERCPGYDSLVGGPNWAELEFDGEALLDGLEMDPLAPGTGLSPVRRLLVAQSGAPEPDELFLETLSGEFELVLADGRRPGANAPPSAEQGPHPVLGSARLEELARSHDADAIVVLFGTFEFTDHLAVGLMIPLSPLLVLSSLFPVGGLIPIRQTWAGLRTRALVIDARTGQHLEIHGPQTAPRLHRTSAILTHQQHMCELADELKAQAFPGLAQRIRSELAP